MPLLVEFRDLVNGTDLLPKCSLRVLWVVWLGMVKSIELPLVRSRCMWFSSPVLEFVTFGRCMGSLVAMVLDFVCRTDEKESSRR